MWGPSDMPDQSGRVAVVTGASSGLGAVVAAALAHRGATVVMGVRDLAKGERVRAGLGAEAAGRTRVLQLELGDLASVARFAADVRAEHTALDLLVNKAGTSRGAEPVSAQGFESVFATTTSGISRSPATSWTCCATPRKHSQSAAGSSRGWSASGRTCTGA